MKRFFTILTLLLTLCLLSSCGGTRTDPIVTTPLRGEGEQTRDPRPSTSLSCFSFTENGSGYTIAKKMGVDLPDRIVIPSHYRGKPVTAIDSNGFAAASNLVAVDIPSTITYVSDGVFPTSVTELTCSATISISYQFKKQIKKLTLTDGVVSRSVFSYMTFLEELKVGSGVTEISASAFYYCTSLKTVAFEEGISYIGEAAFGECPKLVAVQLPDSLTELAPLAFEGCSALQSVSIGSNLERIGSGAFTGCAMLQSGGFTVDAENEHFKVVNGKICDASGADLTNDLFYNLGGK